VCVKRASTGLCGGCRAIGIPTATARGNPDTAKEPPTDYRASSRPYHVIEALAPEGADHAFHKRILPGSTRRCEHFFDTPKCPTSRPT
jgi:hypothetical protein